MRARSVLAAVALCSLGCSSTVTNNAATADAGRDVPLAPVDAPAIVDVPVAIDVGVDVPPVVDVPAVDVPVGSCATRQDALAAQLLSPSAGRLTCSVVVRLDHETLRFIGYQIFCGRYATTTDVQAAQIVADQMIPYATPQMVNPSMPEDAYVFYAPPGDFGGIVAVSARLSLAVFAATEVWGGSGGVLLPTTWRDAAELGDGCDPSGGIPHAHGYALGARTDLPTSDVERVIGAVARTALPGALWRGGSVFDAVVFPWVRSVGGGNEAPSEWVVVVNAGWLE